jgi:hypothetical protein
MKMRLKLYTVVTSPYIGKLFTYRIRCHKSASYSGAISRSETYKL